MSYLDFGNSFPKALGFEMTGRREAVIRTTLPFFWQGQLINSKSLLDNDIIFFLFKKRFLYKKTFENFKTLIFYSSSLVTVFT